MIQETYEFLFLSSSICMHFFKVQMLLIRPLNLPDRHDTAMMELKPRLNHVHSY